jgi:hypothetical protein
MALPSAPPTDATVHAQPSPGGVDVQGVVAWFIRPSKRQFSLREPSRYSIRPRLATAFAIS